MGKRHRGSDDSLMVTSMCDVRHCETSQVALVNFKFLIGAICPFRALTLLVGQEERRPLHENSSHNNF